jgi:hypothetical protein
MKPLVVAALRVLAVLPADETLQRTVLAARILDGDPHALDVGTPLHGLTVSLLAAAADLDPEASAREVWAAWNVLVDPVSSNVAALNLPLTGRGPAALAARAVRGTHVVLTYGPLAASDLVWRSSGSVRDARHWCAPQGGLRTLCAWCCRSSGAPASGYDTTVTSTKPACRFSGT